MKLWHIFLFFGAVLISYSAQADDLSANPWLTKKTIETAKSQIEIPPYDNDSAVLEDTLVNPWLQNNKKNSVALTPNQLKQKLRSAAKNSQKTLQHFSEQTHQLATLSSATSQGQDNGFMPNLIEELSELTHNKQQIQPSNNANPFTFNSSPVLRTEHSRQSFPSLQQQTESLKTEASQAYHRTTDKIKRNIKSKYNALQKQIEPYTNSARNAMQSLEKDNGISMKQFQKIIH